MTEHPPFAESARKMEQAVVQSIGAYIRRMAIDGLAVCLDLSDVREMVRGLAVFQV